MILFVNIFFTKLTWVFYLLLYETIKTHLFTEKNRIGLFFCEKWKKKLLINIFKWLIKIIFMLNQNYLSLYIIKWCGSGPQCCYYDCLEIRSMPRYTQQLEVRPLSSRSKAHFIEKVNNIKMRRFSKMETIITCLVLFYHLMRFRQMS